MSDLLTFLEFAALLRDFIGHCCSAGESGDARFNQLALSLFALQFEHCPPYRQFCRSRKTTADKVSNWRQIPAIPATAFKELEVTSLAPNERTRAFHSSGTSEQPPSRHFHDANSLAVYEASLVHWFRRHVMPERERIQLVTLTPPADEAPHSSLVHMFATVRREFGSNGSMFTGVAREDGAWCLDLEKTVGALRQSISARRPVALLGTAFSFVHLLDYLESIGQRLKLPDHSRALETGGYKSRSRSLPKAELNSLITLRLGIPPARIISEYGMSELGSQAYDCAVGSVPSSQRLFRFPPWARAQIISPETGLEVTEGETGLLRIFDLANVWSVMAVQTEDLAVRREDGFELLGRAAFAEPRGCSLMTS